MKILKVCILLLVLFLVSITIVSAQTSRSLPFLEINADVRTSGMGDANMGNTQGMYLYTNPAAIFQNERKYYGSYAAGIFPKINKSRQYYHALSGGFKFSDKHAVMIGFRSLAGHEIQGFDENGETDIIHPSDISLDLAYTLLISQNIAAYIGGSYLYSDLGETTSSGGINAGVYYQTDQYSAGLSLYNLGGKIKYGTDGKETDLPASVNLGGSVHLLIQENHNLNASLITRYHMLPADASEITAGAGLEYEFQQMLYLRAGYNLGAQRQIFTSGIGVKIESVVINAAYQIGETEDYKLFRIGIGFNL